MKQISKNIIGYIFHSCPKSWTLQPGRFGGSDTLGFVGAAFSLSSSSSNTMGFSTDPSPINKSSNEDGENGVSMPGLNTASISNCEFS